MNKRESLAAAVMAAIGADGYFPFGHGRRPGGTDAQIEARRGYPQTGTGKRQGERIARQVRRAFGDPFKASNECLARIKARLG